MRKRMLFFLLNGIFLTISLYPQANTTNADSLESCLEKYREDDSRRFSVYQGLMNTYIISDTRKSLEYAQMGLRLAKKKNDLFQISEFYYGAGNAFYYLNQKDSSLLCYQQSLDLQKQAETKGLTNNKEATFLQLRLFSSIGVINVARGKFDIALENYLQALAIAEKIKDNEEIIYLLDNLADVYFKILNLKQAESYYLKEDKLCRELNDSSGIANALLGLSKIQFVRMDYSKALEYGEESYRISSTQQNPSSIKLMEASQRLAEVWLKIPDDNKALKYAQMAVKYARETGNSFFMPSALYRVC